jgi:hypothetical protein
MNGLASLPDPVGQYGRYRSRRAGAVLNCSITHDCGIHLGR